MSVTHIFLVVHGSVYLFGRAVTISLGTRTTYIENPLWRVAGGADNFCWRAVAFSWVTRVTYKKYPYTKYQFSLRYMSDWRLKRSNLFVQVHSLCGPNSEWLKLFADQHLL